MKIDKQEIWLFIEKEITKIEMLQMREKKKNMKGHVTYLRPISLTEIMGIHQLITILTSLISRMQLPLYNHFDSERNFSLIWPYAITWHARWA